VWSISKEVDRRHQGNCWKPLETIGNKRPKTEDVRTPFKKPAMDVNQLQ
ncbi:jg21862, partial [Pararge aegeria aegeria]